MKNLHARNLAGAALSLIFALLCQSVTAQPARFAAGTHYQLLPDNPLSQAARDSQTPVVTEIFWYGCPACYSFDPQLSDWVADQGEAISFERSHIVWNKYTRDHARLFFSAQALGVNTALHSRIFDEIHQQQNTLLGESAQSAFLAANGVDSKLADKTLASFATDSSVRKAEALQKSLRVPSIPALVINGRYLVSGSNLASFEEMLEVTEFLVSLDK